MNLNPDRMLLRFISLKDTRPGWSCTLEISGILDLEKDSTFLFVARLAGPLPIAAVEKTLGGIEPLIQIADIYIYMYILMLDLYIQMYFYSHFQSCTVKSKDLQDDCFWHV